MFYIYHRLGIQSNILIAATYDNKNNGSRPLTKPAVLGALQTVVEKQAMMRAVGVMTPSPKKGNHRLHVALLHSIDLETCVDFIDDPEDRGVTPEIIERAHNAWDYATNEPDKPWFKLMVVGGRHIVFVYHHFVADGMSGYVFHREFLTALNSQPSSPPAKRSWVVGADPAVSNVPAGEIELYEKAIALGKPWGASTLEVLWVFFTFWFMNLLFGSRFVFSKLPPSKPILQSPTAIVKDDAQKTVSRSSIARIPADTVRKLIKACRANETTFTPLLITMLLVTQGKDYNPDATYGAPRISANIWQHLPKVLTEGGVKSTAGTMMNCSSGVGKIERIDQYRKADRTVRGAVDKLGERPAYELDSKEIWRLSKRNKAWITDTTDYSMRAMMTGGGIGLDLEDFVSKSMPLIGVGLSPTFLVSNVGPFSPEANGVDASKLGSGEWSISDLIFSAAPTNGRQGTHGPIFSVAGLKGGDTVITASYEDGVLEREAAQEILDATVARLEALVA